MDRIKLSPFLKNILLTTITTAINVLSMIVIIRILAKEFGPEKFGAYSLSRRIISNFAPLVILSLDVALARYIAMTREKKSRGGYIISSLILVSTAMFLVLIFAIGASGSLCNLIFHDKKYLALYYIMFFFLGGYSLTVITYATFLGMQEIKKANLLLLILTSIFPLAISIFFARTKSPSLIILLMGTALYLSLLPLIFVIIRTSWPKLNQLRQSIATLAKYGLPRTPAGFGFMGLFTLGPFLAPYFGKIKDAGFIVVGQSIYRIMELGVVAFGLVALPKIAQLSSESEDEFLKSKIEDVLIMIFQISLFLSIHIFLWIKEIILVWLGPEYMETIPVTKILIISLTSYLTYVMLRSVIDAIEVRAINTINLFLSLTAAAIVSISFGFAGLGIIGLAIGTTTGFGILGIKTSSYLIRRFKISFDKFHVKSVLVLNLIFAAIAFLFKLNIAAILNTYSLLIAGFIFECILFYFYVYIFYRRKTGWILQLKKRIFSTESW
jgi:O-antigen/teichoic acid export membrane protein